MTLSSLTFSLPFFSYDLSPKTLAESKIFKRGLQNIVKITGTRVMWLYAYHRKHQWTLIYVQDPLILEIYPRTCMCRVIKYLQVKWNNICSYCHRFTHCAMRCGRFGSASKLFLWQIIYVKTLISNNHIIYIFMYVRKQTVYCTTATTRR